MGKLMPFCLANDGNSVYAIAYAYLAGPTAPTASAEPDNIILVKSNPFDSISTTTSNPLQDVTWTTLSVVNRFTLNQLRPGYNYGYSCGVSAFDPKHPANFVFTLHVDLTGPVSNSLRFSVQFWREGDSTNMTVVNSRLNEDKGIKDLSANDYWSSAHSSNAALFPMALDSRMVNGSTEWTQMYLNRTTSAIHFLTTAGHIFPDKPQTSWMHQVKSPIAASFNNNTIYVWETEPRHAIIMIPTLSTTLSTADQLALSQPVSRSFWRNVTLSTPEASVVQARIAVNGPLVHLLRFEEDADHKIMASFHYFDGEKFLRFKLLEMERYPYPQLLSADMSSLMPTMHPFYTTAKEDSGGNLRQPQAYLIGTSDQLFVVAGEEVYQMRLSAYSLMVSGPYSSRAGDDPWTNPLGRNEFPVWMTVLISMIVLIAVVGGCWARRRSRRRRDRVKGAPKLNLSKIELTAEPHENTEYDEDRTLHEMSSLDIGHKVEFTEKELLQWHQEQGQAARS